MKTKHPPRIALAPEPALRRAIGKYAKDTKRSRPKACLELIEFALAVKAKQ